MAKKKAKRKAAKGARGRPPPSPEEAAKEASALLEARRQARLLRASQQLEAWRTSNHCELIAEPKCVALSGGGFVLDCTVMIRLKD